MRDCSEMGSLLYHVVKDNRKAEQEKITQGKDSIRKKGMAIISISVYNYG